MRRGILFTAVCAAWYLGVARSVGGAREFHIRVEDDAGVPVSGAEVRMSWMALTPERRMKRMSGVFRTGTDGMALADIHGGFAGINGASKEGYADEPGLNPSGREAEESLHGEGRATRENPCVYRIRRLLPKSYLVIPDSVSTERIIDLKSGGECVTGRVDMLCTSPIRSERVWVDNGLRQKYVRPYPPPYDDLFVSARYDEAADGWRVAFWTTNANCGVIATAGRRYEAPEDGYLPRAEVSQDEYLSPSFTLYLRTREPRVYAMVTPEGWTWQTPRETRGGPPGQRRFRFRLREVRINPYGTREMELENVEYHLSGRLRREALTSLTVRREYPPAHDTGRLSAVASELTRLDRSLGGDYRGFRSLKLATDKKMKARSEAAEGNKEKEASLERDLREEYDSACRRRDELNGILEREFSSKRDGGQK